MPGKAHTPDYIALYIIEDAYNKWLRLRDGDGFSRADGYRLAGIPGAGIRLVDQLLFNTNYFAIQFSNIVVEHDLVSTDSAESMASVERVADLLLGKSSSWTSRLSQYDAASKKDWMKVARFFQDGKDAAYLPPHLDITAIDGKVQALQDPIASKCWNFAKEFLGPENEFYDSLRAMSRDRAYLDPRHQSCASWPLACYRALIPYWVDREAFLPGIAKTLYTSEFWSDYKDFDKMAEDLSDCYRKAFNITPTQAEDYKDKLIKCHEQLVSCGGELEVEPVVTYMRPNEDICGVERFWFNEKPVENPILASNDSFLARKSLLISAIMAPAFMGDLSLLGADERVMETFCYESEYLPRSADASISGNWGELSISLQVAADSAPVLITVNLDGARTDAPVLVLGRGHGGFWEDWAKVLSGALESFYEGQKQTATDKSLIGQIISDAIAEAVKECETAGLAALHTDEVSDRFLTKLGKFLDNCGNCYVRDTRGCTEEQALLPALERITKETLSAAEVAHFDSPNAQAAASKLITEKVKTAGDTFLKTLRGLTSVPSPIVQAIEAEVADFETNNHGDPSASYLFNGIDLSDGTADFVGLKHRLTESLGGNGKVSLEQLVVLIMDAVREYSDYERERYEAVVDAQISRRHAMLLLSDNVLELVDLGSKNGTALKHST